MVGWYHQLNGHEFEQALGDGEGQGGLVCCRPCGCEESDTTERFKNNKVHQRTLSKKKERKKRQHTEWEEKFTNHISDKEVTYRIY